MGSCPPLATAPTPTYVIGVDAAGNAQKWGSCSYLSAGINRTNAANGSNGCFPDADALSSPDRILGYDDVLKATRWYTPVQRYLFEVRGSMTQDQELAKAAGTLNDIISHWVNPISYERGLLGGASWWNPATGRITIRRAAWYRVSFAGLMLRSNAGVSGGTSQGHAYAGVTVVRAAGTIDGTPYPALQGVLRTGESPVIANGKDQDHVFAGEYFGPLGVGDQLWIRVVVANVPDNSYTLNRLYVKDDGRSHFTVAEESTLTYLKI